jgi:hypothetical protein
LQVFEIWKALVIHVLVYIEKVELVSENTREMLEENEWEP